MPVETRAFPPDHEMTSAGTASIFSVGFDNGRMMGRSTPLHISSTTCWVKASWSVEVPMRIVG